MGRCEREHSRCSGCGTICPSVAFHLLGMAELTSMPGRRPYPAAYRKIESLARAEEMTGQLRAQSVDKAGLKVRDPPASASRVLKFNGVYLSPCLFLTI